MNRFPKPDFESGYQYPDIVHPVPSELLWNVLDIVLLVGMMSLVAWAIHKRRDRKIILGVSIVSVFYYGFFRSGCVCSVGSIQNVALALADSSYHMPWFVTLIFLLPILFTFLFGRVFCAGVCPLGALQEVVNVRNFRLSRSVATALSIIPWIYLAFALMYAATRSQFIICRFDPFIGIFRLGGDLGMLIFGIALLFMSVFVGRPFCRFLCPYGALLSIFGSVSIKKMEVTGSGCINCALCHNSCPVDALRPPYSNPQHEERMQGVKRLLAYIVLLPLITLVCSFLVGQSSEMLSLANRDVYLYEMLQAEELQSSDTVPLEVNVFNAMGGSTEELAQRIDVVKNRFWWLAHMAGALIGFVIGCKLIQLSTKRTRKTYEIEHAQCVACGRCFNYCPQNRKK